MEDWKQAIKLAKFELRHSKKALITLGLLLIIFSFSIINSMSTYLEKGFVLFDVFFLIIIGVAAMWAKPKEFQLEKMANNSFQKSYFVMLYQLPIRKEILIKNLFVIYYAYTIPFHALFLTAMYAFSETMQSFLTLPEYIAFSIIWMSFGIYWGVMYPLTDLGEVTKSSTLKMWVYTVLVVALAVGLFILLQEFTGQGVVYWSMIIAKKWPLLSSILSIIAAYLGTTLALRQANKKIKEIDY